jgi:hypothetical protein
VIERENMAAEHAELCGFIRTHCAVDADEPVLQDVLNRLFREPIFQNDLFARFPFKRASGPEVWIRFLKETSSLALANRAHYYLGLRYDVSHHTIHRAIWPDRPSSKATRDSSTQPLQ